MKARGLVWLGTRTRNFDDTVRFFGDTLCLRTVHEEPDFAVFRLPNGDKVEVFGPGDEEHEHFDKGPVAGFLVDDVREACADLEAAGIAFIGVPFTRPTTADHGPTSEDPTATSTRSPRQRNQARRKES
jgi:catechol 2,3-dioxygenase-like lactoylglutathione lyase family enzyme